MPLEERLMSGDKEIKDLYYKCSLAGLNVIKLLWNRPRQSNAYVTGFEIPVFEKQVKRNISDSTNLNIKFIVGGVRFYIDDMSNVWGYVVDTAYNRTILMKSFKTGWYRIVDQNVRNEILAEAKINKIDVELRKTDDSLVKKTPREIRAEQEAAVAMEKTIALNKQIEEMKNKLKQYEGMIPPTKKPLEGVTIKKV